MANENLRTKVKTFYCGGMTFEIDYLEDTMNWDGTGGYMSHFFEMDGSKRRSIGRDFTSIQEAMDWATGEYAIV
jgi:hypothetical protein